MIDARPFIDRPEQTAFAQRGLFVAILVCALTLATPSVTHAVDGLAKPPPIANGRAAEAGPAWKSLRAQEQAALAPLERVWPSLDASRKEKWLVLARRFPAMSSKEQARIRDRMVEWVAMSPLERGRARQNFQEMQIGRLEDRQALWDAYQALPAEQRNELAQRAKPVSSAAVGARPNSSIPNDGRSSAVNKRNIVPAHPTAAAPRPVSPTLVQAKPGATTTLLTKSASPPVHNQPGLPKIAATDGFVNPSTLLPKRGPQGAAARSAAAQASQPMQQ